MTPDPNSPVQALIQQAAQALQQGDRLKARQLASQAAHLAPELEEPWLILAALASPEASLTYLQRALKINPGSQRAQQGVRWALKRQQAAAEHKAAAAQPAPHPAASPTPPRSEPQGQLPGGLPAPQPVAATAPNRVFSNTAASTQPIATVAAGQTIPMQVRRPRPARRRFPLGLLLLGALVIILGFGGLAVGGYFLYQAAQPDYYAAPHAVSVLVKPSLTPTDTPLPTSTPTATATSTSTPLPTGTPTPLPTATSTPEPSATSTRPAPTRTRAAVQPTISSGGSAGSSGGSSEGRWIDVDLAKQRVYAYEGDEVVKTFVVSTGTKQHPTVKGKYKIYVKYRYANMTGPGYSLKNVPYVMYFYQGYGLHGTYWHSNFGTPMSHGCVNLRTEEAGWLYNWASIGTLVNVH